MVSSYTYATEEQMATIQRMLADSQSAVAFWEVAEATGLDRESATAALKRAEKDGVAEEIMPGYYTQHREQPESSGRIPVLPTTAAGKIAARMAYVGTHMVVGVPNVKAPSVGNHPGPFIFLIVFIWLVIMAVPLVLQIVTLLVVELSLGIAWIVVAPFSAVSLMLRKRD
jgi:hypothetical protein